LISLGQPRLQNRNVSSDRLSSEANAFVKP
jgi:hypothetical protein